MGNYTAWFYYRHRDDIHNNNSIMTSAKYRFKVANDEVDPTITLKDWYYGYITRKEVIKYLISPVKIHGTYLVRKPITTKDCCYVLSILCWRRNTDKYYIKNVKIYYDKKRKFYLNSKYENSSVEGLLEHYKDQLGIPSRKRRYDEFDMEPFSYFDGDKLVEIQRKLLYDNKSAFATVELVTQ